METVLEMKELRIRLVKAEVAITDPKRQNSENRLKKYECKLCAKQFRTHGYLREHILTHTRENEYKCNTCGKGFPKLTKLRQHERIHDAQRPREFKCEQCSKSFQEKYLLKAHQVTHLGTKEFKCPQCPKLFLKKVGVNSHLLTHTKEKSYNCSKCKKEIANSSNLKAHEKKAHTIACCHCQLRFVNRYDLNYHMQEHGEEVCKFCESFYRVDYIEEHLLSHDGPLPFQCNVCFKKFSTKTSIRLHRVKHTEKHCCEICKKCFANIRILSNHKLTHMDENNFPCKTCDKKFKTDNNLRIHTNKWHTEPAIFTCSACGETFTQEAKAKEHAFSNGSNGHAVKVKYIPAKPFKCGFCDTAFSAKNDMDRHILTHTNIKDHICQFCEKPFAAANGLLAHLRTHTGERPFHCDIPNCGLQFITTAALKKHKEIHSTNRKLHICPLCGKKYLFRSLRVHLANHKNTSTHWCEYKNCKKYFKKKSELNRHVRAVHLGEKSHVCSLCDMTFFSKSHLVRHADCHVEDDGNTYICDYCKKEFRRQGHLDDHIQRMHTGREKSHGCTFCEKCFSTRTGLMTHIKTHTKEKAEKCEMCDKTFNSNSNLYQHIKKYHRR